MLWHRGEAHGTRTRRFVALVSVVLCLLGVAWYFATAQKRRALREVSALNGIASSTHKLGTPVSGFDLQYGPVDNVYFLGPKLDDRKLEVLDGFPDLRTINLTNTRVSDEGLTRLARFRELTNLYVGNLDHTKLIGPAGSRLDTRPLAGGRGLGALKDLPKLHTVQLFGPGTSDDDLDGLASLEQLRTLDFMGTKVTKEGVARLQKHLPNCVIKLR